MPQQYFKFNGLLLREGWMMPAYVGVGNEGQVTYLSSESPGNAIAIEVVLGFALPGFQNAHSHAFQYAMAGLAESHAKGTTDDFWTWREAMYRCALSVDPDQAEAIAAMLYTEMIRHGYTHVAEFHYLHHDKNGALYNQRTEMGERMLRAATRAGIKITLIPVFYQKGNFGVTPYDQQRRFITKTIDEYFQLLGDTANLVKKYNDAHLGFSVHSLRAVDLQDIVKIFNSAPKDIPFHLHIAEQKKEVTDCINYIGKRPVEWLLENLPVNERFHLVHATHLNDDELNGIVRSSANVILCPSTEGNLGDGIFKMREYVKAGGRWCIGTDSHIGLNPLAELRMIDYRQRLISHQRNTFDGDGAQYLVTEEIESGRMAMGVARNNFFSLGKQFDAVVFDANAPLLATTSAANLLPTVVYTAERSNQLGTLINGKWLVKNNHHHQEEQIKNSFVMAMKELKNR